MSKFEPKYNFSSFRCWVWGKIENLEISEILIFPLNRIGSFWFLFQFIFCHFQIFSFEDLKPLNLETLKRIS